MEKLIENHDMYIFQESPNAIPKSVARHPSNQIEKYMRKNFQHFSKVQRKK